MGVTRPAPQRTLWNPYHPRAVGVRFFGDLYSARDGFRDLVSGTGASVSSAVIGTASLWGRAMGFNATTSLGVATWGGRGLAYTPPWFTAFALFRYDSAPSVESEILCTSSSNAGLGINVTSSNGFNFGIFSVAGVSSGLTLTTGHTYALGARWTQSGSNNIRWWVYDYTAGGTFTTASGTNNSTPLVGNGNATVNPNFGNGGLRIIGGLSLVGYATIGWDDTTFLMFARDPFAPARPAPSRPLTAPSPTYAYPPVDRSGVINSPRIFRIGA